MEARCAGIADNVDARGGFQRIFHAGDALVVHLPFGNHAHRLRRFLGRQRKPCGGTHGGGGVAVSVFGAGAAVAGGDLDAFQFGAAAFIFGSIIGPCGCGSGQQGSDKGGFERVLHNFPLIKKVNIDKFSRRDYSLLQDNANAFDNF